MSKNKSFVKAPYWIPEESYGPLGHVVALIMTLANLDVETTTRVITDIENHCARSCSDWKYIKYGVAAVKSFNHRASEYVLEANNRESYYVSFDEFMEWFKCLPSLNMRQDKPEDRAVLMDIRETWKDIFTASRYLKTKCKTEGMEFFVQSEEVRG